MKFLHISLQVRLHSVRMSKTLFELHVLQTAVYLSMLIRLLVLYWQVCINDTITETQLSGWARHPM